MSTSVFESNVSLKLKSQQFENLYKQMKNKRLRRNGIILSLSNIFISLIYNLALTFNFIESNDFFLIYLRKTSYSLSALQSTVFICLLFSKNPNFQRFFSYMNLSAIILHNMAFRMFLLIFAKIDPGFFNLVLIFHQIYPIIWVFCNIIDFVDGFWVFMSVSIVSLLILAPFYPSKFLFRFSIQIALTMSNSLFSYFYIYEKKKSFYHNQIKEVTIKSYKSIIQNMNSGFLKVKNLKIIDTNKVITALLTRIKISIEKKNPISINIKSSNENLNLAKDMFICLSNVHEVEKDEILLEEFFKDIHFTLDDMIDSNVNDYKTILYYLEKINAKSDINREDFIFIGTKTFVNPNDRNDTFYYEIFGRYCQQEDEEDGNFEFMLNDVSKTKIKEELNADMKYKTIFLSKVAHEFKNPLICISEIVDQVIEKLGVLNCTNPFLLVNAESVNSNYSKKEIKEHLTYMKSLSEYLQILVKDLDFFSLKTPGSTAKIKLEKEDVKLKGIINYCENITQVLLKKFQKDKNIIFKVCCSEELLNKKIHTDELRLKQLLINLLSNSVKYTNSGSITLEAKEKDKYVIFDIADTGQGLSDENKTYLDTNYLQDRKIGAHTSGLGFSIIKEIVELLGSKLNYQSYFNKGTNFTFKIPIDVKESSEIVIFYDTRSKQSECDNSKETIHKEFYPSKLNIELFNESKNSKIFESENIQRINSNSLLQSHISIKFENSCTYIILVDDETFTRKFSVRVLNNYFNKIISESKNFIILEASDGIECLNLVYKSLREGNEISFIISDQTMNYMNGSTTALILNDIIKYKCFKRIPYFILTAYEGIEFNKEIGVNKTYSKPLSFGKIEDMIQTASII